MITAKKFMSSEQLQELQDIARFYNVYGKTEFLTDIENYTVRVDTWTKDGDTWDEIKLKDTVPNGEDLDYADLQFTQYVSIKNLSFSQTISLFEVLQKS